jgi:pimeloyl-ACP methyl ester carboxylesterase
MTGSMPPTVVLVHGAFADASGFGGVIRELTTSGHEVVAPPNPRAAWPSTRTRWLPRFG